MPRSPATATRTLPSPSAPFGWSDAWILPCGPAPFRHPFRPAVPVWPRTGPVYAPNAGVRVCAHLDQRDDVWGFQKRECMPGVIGAAPPQLPSGAPYPRLSSAAAFLPDGQRPVRVWLRSGSALPARPSGSPFRLRAVMRAGLLMRRQGKSAPLQQEGRWWFGR